MYILLLILEIVPTVAEYAIQRQQQFTPVRDEDRSDWEFLPYEVLYKIFTVYRTPAYLETIRLVCSDWYHYSTTDLFWEPIVSSIGIPLSVPVIKTFEDVEHQSISRLIYSVCFRS